LYYRIIYSFKFKSDNKIRKIIEHKILTKNEYGGILYLTVGQVLMTNGVLTHLKSSMLSENDIFMSPEIYKYIKKWSSYILMEDGKFVKGFHGIIFDEYFENNKNDTIIFLGHKIVRDRIDRNRIFKID
jgi:hypothetical protein